jgi:hypothetical protein
MKARDRMSTITTDTDAIVDELIELGEIALRPGPLWLGGGLERYGITERARRALLGRGDRRP